MARVYMFLFLLELFLTVFALISCLSAYEGEVRGLPKAFWVIIIILFPIGGAIIYYVGGRPLPGETGPSAAPTAERTRPSSPDDDPAFLNSIDTTVRRSDEELLRRWEEDLKRPEDDLRRPEETPPSDG